MIRLCLSFTHPDPCGRPSFTHPDPYGSTLSPWKEGFGPFRTSGNAVSSGLKKYHSLTDFAGGIFLLAAIADGPSFK